MNLDIYVILIVAASIFFFLSLATNKAELLVNFILRMLVGILAIYCINKGFTYAGMRSGVEINVLTAGVSGVLGMQGLLIMYALGVYFQLR